MTRWDAFKAALLSGGWAGVVNTLIGLGVTVGFLTSTQSSALVTVVAGIATLLNLVVTTIHTVQTARVLRANAALEAKIVRLQRPDVT